MFRAQPWFLTHPGFPDTVRSEHRPRGEVGSHAWPLLPTTWLLALAIKCISQCFIIGFFFNKSISQNSVLRIVIVIDQSIIVGRRRRKF